MVVMASACIPDYDYYRDVYGGELTHEEFAASLVLGIRHVAWLTNCKMPLLEERQEAYRRAVCVCTDVFSEYGDTEVGGFS